VNYLKGEILNNFLLCAIAFTLPFSILFNNISIIVFIAFTLVCNDFWINIVPIFKERKWTFVLFVLFYFLHVIGLAWTENMKDGFFNLEKKLTLVLFPIFILLNGSITEKIIRNALWAFIAACLLLSVVCITSSVYFCYIMEEFTIENFSRDILLRHVSHFTHATDLAIYLIFSIIVTIDTINSKWKKVGNDQILIWFILCLFFFVMVILLSARMPMIFLILISAGLIYRLLVKKIGVLLGSFASVFSIFLFISLFQNVQTFGERYKEILIDYNSFPYGAHHNSTNIRNACFYCSFENIKENLWFGVGTGDVQDNLTECYKKNNFSSILYKDIYNSHNQFLQTTVGLGLIGFIVLTIFASYMLFLSFRNDFIILTLFLMLFFFLSLTESMLEHQKGLVFFSYMACLLVSRTYLKFEKII
jgi:O-antigen ligase